MESLEAASGQLLAAWKNGFQCEEPHGPVGNKGLEIQGSGRLGSEVMTGKGQGNKDWGCAIFPGAVDEEEGAEVVEQKPGGKEMEMVKENMVVNEVKVKAGPWSLNVDAHASSLEAIQLEVETECSGWQSRTTVTAQVWSGMSTLPRAEELHCSEYPQLLGQCLLEPSIAVHPD